MLKILPSDTGYTNSPMAGDPACTCSRCGIGITDHELPFRIWVEDQQVCEYRYCDACQTEMGFYFFGAPDPDLQKNSFDPMDDIKREDCP